MIERYSRPEMSRIFATTARFQTWLDVEAAVSRALERRGLVPAGIADAIERAGPIDPARVEEIEQTTHHDVIAFLSAVSERMGPPGRFLHHGMTSSDLIDTALGLTLRRASMVLRTGLCDLSDVVRARAMEFRRLPCVGRTHGVIAEPTTFGLKLLGWYAELNRQLVRLDEAVLGVAVGKISGAVGTFSHLPPDVEEEVCHRLGLSPEPVSTQVAARDRHATLVMTLAGLSASLERMATEVRNLQRSEILEAEEHFAVGQKGSSAMPHKRNPITAERVAGLARLLRGYAVSALENVALWHERDITHSSVERVILADSFLVVDYQLHLMTRIVQGLIVYPRRMVENLNRAGGIVYSQRVLLALTEAGLPREDAYLLVQRAAHTAWENGGSFRALTEADPEIASRLEPGRLNDCFDLDHGLRHIDDIFRRVLGDDSLGERFEDDA
ncbi:MAG: adenylosuccinate lyase [Candidatus Eisenbacteria bacterium]|nr:adenylosuccinate lyase [Candidatus Eisenbacteria bacterium]